MQIVVQEPLGPSGVHTTLREALDEPPPVYRIAEGADHPAAAEEA